MDFAFIEDKDVRELAVTNYKAAEATRKDDTQKLIDDAVTGLKDKNAQLLDEKKQIQKTLKNFDGMDAKAAAEALKFLDENEDAQLIKDGKIDELLDRRTSTMRTEHEEAVETLTTSLLDKTTSSDRFKGLYEGKLLDDALTKAAVTAKVETTAIADIILNGRNVFSVTEDGSIEARDKDNKILKTADDKVLDTANWIEGKRETSPHWWGKSESGNLNPGDGSDDDYAAALARAAASGDSDAYRRLRDKRKKK